MGYTHYWRFKGEVAPKDLKNGRDNFFKASAIIAKALHKVNEKKIKVCGGNGEGLPRISDDYISFNGCRADDEHCETFSIDINDGGFNCCKTCREPYDLLVCLSLLAFKYVFGEDFIYKSDGVTRESINDPEKIAYWRQIGWTPKVDDDWEYAYKVWDELKSELGLE